MRALLLASLLPVGCVAGVGVPPPFRVPEDGFAQCSTQCGTMGLRATSMVIMAGQVGCVCEPRDGATAPKTQAAVTAASFAAADAAEDDQDSTQD